METTLLEQLDAIDTYIRLQDSVYQQAAAKIGISQVALYVFSFLYRAEGVCTQNDMVSKWLHPKQTISFTVNKLSEQGYVRQEPLAGTKNKKGIYLTQEGLAFCRERVSPILDAELAAFSGLSEEERDAFVSVTRRHYALLSEKMNKLFEGSSEDRASQCTGTECCPSIG